MSMLVGLLFFVAPVIITALFSYWLGTRIEKFFYRHTGQSVLAGLAGVFLYLTAFPFFSFIASSLIQGVKTLLVIDNKEITVLLYFTNSSIFTKMLGVSVLTVWFIGIVLLIAKIRSIRLNNQVIMKSSLWEFTPIFSLVLLLMTSMLSNLLFFVLSLPSP